MKKVTIATHNGSKVRRAHNVRDPRVVEKQPHIRQDGKYEIWRDEDPRTAYHRLFDDAIARYNARQTRNDRKIRDYYSHIDRSERQHTVYEMIISVGNSRGEMIDEKTGYEIMKEFVDTWRERNPNLEMIGAYYHADEDGVPHVHLDYVPWYSERFCEYGPDTKTGLVRALAVMGFEKRGRETAQIQWQRRENRALENICNRHGVEVDHPDRKLQHLETEVYKLEQQRQEQIRRYNALVRRHNALVRRCAALGIAVAERETELGVDDFGR